MMKWIRALLISVLAALCASLLLLAATAFITARMGSLPRSSLTLVTTLAACGAVFLGGLAGALSAKERGLLLGLGCGAVFLLCAAAATVLLFGAELEPASGGKAAAVLLSGAIGGILGANRKHKVKF